VFHVAGIFGIFGFCYLCTGVAVILLFDDWYSGETTGAIAWGSKFENDR